MQRPFPAYRGDDPYVFVSYSHADADVVYPELERMRSAGFNVWYDDGIEPGSTWRDEVALALANCGMLVFLVSPNAVQSPNCQQELNFALTREKKILCVHLQATPLPPGLELSLSDKQAILRYELNETTFDGRLRDAIGKVLLQQRPPSAIISQPAIVEDDARESIAVLPLTNRNLDTDLDYLTEGVAEELIRGLAQVDGLRVASQIATFKLKDLELDEVGRRLNVEHVLSGSIQRGGDRLRVNVLLSRVADGSTLWTQRYDGTLEDVFDFQDDVARQVVEALKLELSPEAEATPVDVGTRNAQAYQAYLLGRRALEKTTLEGTSQAKTLFRQAVNHDPDFVEAYYYLANATALPGFWFGSALEPIGDELHALLPALRRVDPDRNFIDWDFIDPFLEGRFPASPWEPLAFAQSGIDLINRKPTRVLDPAMGFFYVGQAASVFGLNRAAAAFGTRFIERQSHSPGWSQAIGRELVGYTLGALGELSAAIDVFDASLEEDEDRFNARVIRSCMYSRTGQYQRAGEELEIIATIVRRNHAVFCDLYWRGETDDAIAYFDDLARRPNYPLWLKAWGALMLCDDQLGDVANTEARLQQTIDYLYEGAEHHTAMVPMIRATAGYYCPEAVVAKLEASEAFRTWCRDMSFGDTARDEFVEFVNAHADLTGIRITELD